uniref:divalent metal cation transporter n=1 Tax=Ligilactobacillus saerimneri TaxID=228229 RepID=UPI00242CBFFE
DSNIQLSFAFIVNSLLLIMGVAVFKTGAVKDPSFFGLYEALSNTSMLSNGVLIAVAKSGILSVLFAVALLASGQNSTITGTLTGQVIMEGFIHMRMPLWARRLITRLLSVVPVLICVALTSGESTIQQHEAINNLMNNSQVFLAFALPFSMLPLLLMTNSEHEMGARFKNSLWVKVVGWISVIGLTFLNLKGLPENITDFFGDNPSAHEIALAHNIAYFLIVLILALLIWTVIDIIHGDRKLAAKKQAAMQAQHSAE